MVYTSIKRKIIVLCGSTKFKEDFEYYNNKFTLEGNIVLIPGCYPHYDKIQITNEQKESLDILHKDKILMSDIVFIINKDGYIGSSTESEINFSKNNKLKLYME